MKYFLSILIIFSTISNSFSSSQNSLIRVAAGEWPPYLGRELKDNGCLGKFIKDIFKSQSINVKFSFMPWNRAYVSAKNGSFDATAYWFDREDRRKDFIFPIHNLTIEKSFFFFNINKPFKWEKYSDLKGRHIIMNRGYTYNRDIYEAILEYDIETTIVNSESQNFSMISQGRGDLTIMAEGPSLVYLKELSAKYKSIIKRSKKPATVSKGYLLISKKSSLAKKYKDAFDKGYKILSSDQKYFSKVKKTCDVL